MFTPSLSPLTRSPPQSPAPVLPRRPPLTLSTHFKTGRTSCTNWTISFGVSWFRTRTHLLHGHFIFLTLFELQTFFAFLCTIQRDVINFQHFLTSFAIFQSFTNLFRELNDREIENHYKMNSKNVETWHGIIISPA